MADHWEFAWQKARGDYVLVNSDDDVFSPQLLTRFDTASRKVTIGMASWDAGLYLHPDWDMAGANTFRFEASHTGLVFEIDPWRVIAAYADLNILRCFPLGTRIFFSRQLGERVRERVGRLFWSPFPDFSAPLLLLARMERNERYVYLDSMLGYGGRSRNSNAAATVPRERGRTGRSARAQGFIAEHGAMNLFEDLEFQAVGLTNGHAQTLALLRRILPEVFDRFQLDMVAYIAGVEGEFRGINVHNPWLGPDERAQFDRFLSRQDPKLVKQALQIVEQRWFNDKLEQWRKDRRQISMPVIRHILKSRVLLQAARKVLGVAFRVRNLAQAEDSNTDSRGEIHADRHGVMVTVHCDSFGGRDGLDLAHRLDEVVIAFDRRDTRNLADFYTQHLMLAAHAPEALLQGDAAALSRSKVPPPLDHERA